MRILLRYDNKTVPVEIDDHNFVRSLVSIVQSFPPGRSFKAVEHASRIAALDNFHPHIVCSTALAVSDEHTGPNSLKGCPK